MNILWVINAPIPVAAEVLGIPQSGFPSWVEAAYEALSGHHDLTVSMVFPSSGAPREATVGGATFASFPTVEHGREGDALVSIEKLVRRINPDLVHVFGTEAGHALAVAQACRRLKVPFVVGLQGLSSTIGEHYTSGLPAAVVHGWTLRDLVRRDNVWRQAERFRRWGENERRTLELANFVIGRTTWDRAVAEQHNPDARYFRVPETLRPKFYLREWTIETCEPHSIFVSQGHYPVKGLHFVLRAMPAILERHPNTQLFVSGWPVKGDGLRGRLRQTGYAAYLRRLITRLGLEGKVHFVGVLDAKEMVDRFLSSHVFVSASTVENESNSLSEAQLLGVPCVASYVGGVTDRIVHGSNGFLYQHDAPYMLAHYVSGLFEDSELCRRLGAEGRRTSLSLNDPATNADLLLAAYREILAASAPA